MHEIISLPVYETYFETIYKQGQFLLDICSFPIMKVSDMVVISVSWIDEDIFMMTDKCRVRSKAQKD